MALQKEAAMDALERTSDAIHTLAQPLTALSFVVDMALLQNSPDVWKTALEQSCTETRRAVAALNVVREALEALGRENTARHKGEE